MQVRAEQGQDGPGIRAVNEAAFETPAESAAQTIAVQRAAIGAFRDRGDVHAALCARCRPIRVRPCARE